MESSIWWPQPTNSAKLPAFYNKCLFVVDKFKFINMALCVCYCHVILWWWMFQHSSTPNLSYVCSHTHSFNKHNCLFNCHSGSMEPQKARRKEKQPTLNSNFTTMTTNKHTGEKKNAGIFIYLFIHWVDLCWIILQLDVIKLCVLFTHFEQQRKENVSVYFSICIVEI